MDFKEILGKFKIKGDIESVKTFGAGHINETYLVKTNMDSYILQSLNTSVFKNYEGVMDNIFKVTSFIKDNYPDAKTLYLIKTKDGKNFYFDEGNCYRMMNFIDNSVVFQQTSEAFILEQAGFGLGDFISKLDKFDASELVEVIPNFHNTKKRFVDFENAVKNDRAFRAKSVQKEIDFVLSRKELCSLIVDKIANKTIPLRVTHNDTKLNNFMFDKDSHEFVCLVDLDTIMPGSLLYDFGDAIRIAASTAGEEERDLDKVKFDIKAYEAFLKGFLHGIGKDITYDEAQLLHIGAKIMTFEIGMRFLEDYLNGDAYFKVHEEDGNLVRSRTQLKMVEEIESYEPQMKNLLNKYFQN